MIRPDVTWEDRHGSRGSVKIDSLGLRVATTASLSPDLTDTAKLQEIYDGLGALLAERRTEGR